MKRRSMSKTLFIPVLSGILVLISLVQPQSALSIVGQWGVTFAIDAPWRLEPIPTNSGYTYGKIPIVISFRQAINEMGREYGGTMRAVTGAGPAIWVGKAKEVTVVEYIDQPPYPNLSIAPAQFREIERKRELSTKQNEPRHEICRPFLGEPCDNILWITDTDEWHAVFWYAPQTPVTPGRNIHLQVTVITGSGADATELKEWTSSLVVHAGEAPLPRFGNNWLYGDLHYHAQMTGNEGEYGHAYRNVARMLGPLGLDFVFTTDHASNGEQVLGEVTTGRCGSLSGSLCKNYIPNLKVPNSTQCTDEGKTMQCMMYRATEARDLNASRFAWAKAFIYGPGGANDAVARDAEFGFGRLHSANILPQLYMGEEVDAQPEMSSKEFRDGVIYYGDGLKYPWLEVGDCLENAARAFAFGGAAALHGLTPREFCGKKYSEPYAERDHRSYIVKDNEGVSAEEKVSSKVGDKTHSDALGIIAGKLVSGLSDLFGADINVKPIIAPARQHLVYLPTDASSASIGWIASDTTRFGGAGKHLEDIIHEVEANKGYTFLAHPLVGPQPGGPPPDVVPYSDYALDRAWGSQAVLGLQFWNEDYNRKLQKTSQHSTLLSDADRKYNLLAPFRLETSFPWTWPLEGEEGTATPQNSGPVPPEDLWLYDGAYTWDRYLRKGLNIGETAMLPWLTNGEPRKWFMAGGSDGHGDFNYRILGEVCDGRWCTTGIQDTAIGKTRNLVMVEQPPRGIPPPDLPDAKRYTNSQVIEALKTGQFSITNGPAIRIAIDKNRNGRIDDADFQMGSTFNLFPGEQIPLLVEWESTLEFGPLAQIDVYVGTPSKTYAGRGHGPVIPMAPDYQNVPSGRNPDYGNYHADPTGALQIRLVTDKSDAPAAPGISPEMRLHGAAQFLLSPQEFGLSGADRSLFYLRAFAKTREGNSAASHGECAPFNTAGTNCGSGRTYSNPIWGRFNMACPANGSRPTSGELGYLDADNNGVPDICERILPDPCPGAIGCIATNSGGLRPDFPAASPVESPLATPPQVSDPPAPPVNPVNPTGQLSAPRSCQLPVQLVGHVPVTPSPTGSITGTVINGTTQEPLVEKVIRVKGSEVIARTRSDGRFTLEGIPEGLQTVLFNITGFQDDVTRTVMVVPEQSVSVGTVAMPVRTFTGKLIGQVVIDDTMRAPIPGATVAVTVDATGKSFQTQTDSDGNFEFLQVPAGFITITVSKPGFTSKSLPGQVKEDRTGNAGAIRLVPN